MYQRSRPRSARAIEKPYRFLRLRAAVDAKALLDEIEAARVSFAPSEWKWHLETRFCVLRAGEDTSYAGSGLVRGSGVDKPVLESLPKIRRFLNSGLPAPVTRAWLGLSPPGARIFLHVDNTSEWDEQHRIHVPLKTHEGARLCTGGRFAHLAAGSMWLFNNSLPHGMINHGPERLHLVLDVAPSAELSEWLRAGERVEGEVDDASYAELSRNPLESLRDEDWADVDRMYRFFSQ
jgi:kumamolisin